MKFLCHQGAHGALHEGSTEKYRIVIPCRWLVRQYLAPVLWAVFLGAVSGCASIATDSVPVIRLSNLVRYSQDPRYYIVRPGDTLYSIAWHYELDFRDLARRNHIPNPYWIAIGQKIRVRFKLVASSATAITVGVPGDTGPGSISPPAAVIHRVQVGPKSAHQTDESVIAPMKKSVTKWSWPVKGKIIGFFSPVRGGNKGIDVVTAGAQPVRAIADGKVVYSGSGLRGYGKLVIVKHNDDFLSAYAYNARIRVKENVQVKAGQIIADTGSDGLYKNRLHLEIRYRGKPQDPLKYLNKG